MSSHSHGSLGLTMAVILGMNAIIGAGIFAIPAQLLQTAGPAGLVTFGAVIFGILGIALAFARVAQQYPERGAMYTYARVWAGPQGGALTLLLYCAGLIVALSLLAIIAATYAEPYTALSVRTLAVLMIIGVTLANTGGQRSNSAWQIILLILTLLPLLLIAGLALTRASLSSFTPFAPHGVQGMFTAVKTVVFAFFGFEAIPALFSSLKNPQRTVSRAIVLTILLVGLVYLGFTAAITAGFPAPLFNLPSASLSSVLLAHFPTHTWLVHLINGAIIITILGTMHAMMWAISSLLQDGIHRIAPILKPSRMSLLASMASMMILVALVANQIGTLFALVSVGIVSAYASSIMPLVYYPRPRSSDFIIGCWGLISCLLLLGCALRDLL